jgi:hypothetical protein
MPHIFEKSSGLLPQGVTVGLGIALLIAAGLFFYGQHLEQLGSVPGATEIVYGAVKLLVAGIIASLTFGAVKRV